jgi:hypothetical protein
MEFVIVLAILCIVVLVVSAPLWSRGESPLQARSVEPPDSPGTDVTELEAAREAKYREIRDAELDYQTGKLSDADWKAIDGTLRGQAVEILRALDRAKQR